MQLISKLLTLHTTIHLLPLQNVKLLLSAPETASFLEHVLCLTACTLNLLPQTMLAVALNQQRNFNFPVP